MNRLLRLLVVEGSQEDAFLLARELHRGGYEPTIKRVKTAEAMRSALREERGDLVIA